MFSLENATRIKFSDGLARGKDDKVDAYRIAKYAYRYAENLPTYQPKRAIVWAQVRLIGELAKNHGHPVEEKGYVTYSSKYGSECFDLSI